MMICQRYPPKKDVILQGKDNVTITYDLVLTVDLMTEEINDEI